MEDPYKQEIEGLFLELYPLLFEYARSVLSRDALAEEAVQDAFAIACQKPEALLSSPNPKGWMVNTLKNVLKNTVRRQISDRKMLQEYFMRQVGDKALNPLEALELVYGDLVDTEEFQLVKAVAFDEVTYQELAEKWGITVSGCRKRMQRAREFLQSKIDL